MTIQDDSQPQELFTAVCEHCGFEQRFTGTKTNLPPQLVLSPLGQLFMIPFTPQLDQLMTMQDHYASHEEN